MFAGEGVRLPRFLGVPAPKQVPGPGEEDPKRPPPQTLYEWFEWGGRKTPAPKAPAETLATNLARHPQLRSLAANALLLELIARVAVKGEVQLPASRAWTALLAR